MAAPDQAEAGLSPATRLLVEAAVDAGRTAMRYFRGDNRAWTKAGNSPVSEADIAVDRQMREFLLAALPGCVWVSEEDEQPAEIPETGKAVVTDPIDGTRGFLAGDPNWAIAAAIVEDLRVRCGVVFSPALDRLFVAEAGKGAWRNGVRLDATPASVLRRVTGSKRIISELKECCGGSLEVSDFVPSLACRLVMVADASLDVAFARPGAHVWDVAAASLILAESGASLVTASGEPWRMQARRARAPALVAAGPGRLPAALALAKSAGILQ